MRFKKENIQGYESMTAEQKLEALENYEFDMSDYVSKAQFDKTASEVASYKKQLREKMTEEEATKAKEAEEKAQLMARLEELENERTVSGYVNSYLGLGYEEKLAKATAEAMAKGDMETVFKNQKIHLENIEKNVKAELLKKTPAPKPNSDNGSMTLDEFKKMSMPDRHKFSVEHPEEYKQLYGGK